MKKFAVIDIGSNSVRLMFVADGNVLYKRLNTTRLGEGLARKPILTANAIERTARAVELFYQTAKSDGAETVVAFATAAVRSAENGSQFVERVKELCGLEVEVISGEEEAEIGVLGALGEADGGVVDIGGASTEIVVKEKGVLVYKKSVDVGVVRLKDKCGADEAALIKEAKAASIAFGVVSKIGVLHGVGGTITTLATQILRLEEYDSARITGVKITAEQIHEIADKLLKMTVEEIAALPCMPKGRADVLTGGAVLLSTLMRELKIDALVASDADNLEGYAIKRGLMR